MTPKEYYIKQNRMGKCDNITSNPNPDYNQCFYQEIFNLMEGYKQVSIESEVKPANNGHKCESCGKPLSHYCDNCQKLWES